MGTMRKIGAGLAVVILGVASGAVCLYLVILAMVVGTTIIGIAPSEVRSWILSDGNTVTATLAVSGEWRGQVKFASSTVEVVRGTAIYLVGGGVVACGGLRIDDSVVECYTPKAIGFPDRAIKREVRASYQSRKGLTPLEWAFWDLRRALPVEEVIKG